MASPAKEHERFKIEESDGAFAVVFRSGAKRPATPEEIQLWQLVEGGCERSSLLGWYLFYRLGDVSIDKIEPKWLNTVIRDFYKLDTLKLVKMLRDEFPDNFREPKHKEVACVG